MAERVVHVVQSLGHGGAEHFVVDLANTQGRNGLRVSITEVGPAPGPAGALAEVPLTLVRKTGRASVPAVVALARRLRDERPDVVHTHTFTGLGYGHLAARVARVPVLHTYHSAGGPDRLYGRRQAGVDRLLRRSDAVVVFAEEQRDVLARRLGRAVDVVPNGVPLPPPVDRHAVRARLGVGDAEVLAVAVGGLRPEKGYGLLLDALAASPVTTLVVGDGTERDALERRRSELGLDAVRFLGARPDAREILAAADLFVNTSEWEGMPIAVLEAMAAGCPVVCAGVGNLRDVVGPAGLVVPRTVEGFADAIRALLDDAASRERLGAAGRDRVRERYSIDAAAAAYSALYERL